MRGRPSPLPALLVATALLLAGCGADGDDGAATTSTTDPAPATTTSAATPSTRAGTDPSTETTGVTLAPTSTTTPTAASRLQLRPVIGSEPCSAVNPAPDAGPGSTDTTVPEPDQPELVPDVDGDLCYGLGPVGADGGDLTEAEAALDGAGQWSVEVRARPGSVDALNALFDACHAGAATCPAVGPSPGRVAVVVDGAVVSAPSVQSAGVAGDAFQISGNFTRAEAEDLAATLDRG